MSTSADNHIKTKQTIYSVSRARSQIVHFQDHIPKRNSDTARSVTHSGQTTTTAGSHDNSQPSVKMVVIIPSMECVSPLRRFIKQKHQKWCQRQAHTDEKPNTPEDWAFANTAAKETVSRVVAAAIDVLERKTRRKVTKSQRHANLSIQRRVHMYMTRRRSEQKPPLANKNRRRRSPSLPTWAQTQCDGQTTVWQRPGHAGQTTRQTPGPFEFFNKTGIQHIRQIGEVVQRLHQQSLEWERRASLHVTELEVTQTILETVNQYKAAVTELSMGERWVTGIRPAAMQPFRAWTRARLEAQNLTMHWIQETAQLHNHNAQMQRADQLYQWIQHDAQHARILEFLPPTEISTQVQLRTTTQQIKESVRELRRIRQCTHERKHRVLDLLSETMKPKGRRTTFDRMAFAAANRALAKLQQEGQKCSRMLDEAQRLVQHTGKGEKPGRMKSQTSKTINKRTRPTKQTSKRSQQQANEYNDSGGDDDDDKRQQTPQKGDGLRPESEPESSEVSESEMDDSDRRMTRELDSGYRNCTADERTQWQNLWRHHDNRRAAIRAKRYMQTRRITKAKYRALIKADMAKRKIQVLQLRQQIQDSRDYAVIDAEKPETRDMDDARQRSAREAKEKAIKATSAMDVAASQLTSAVQPPTARREVRLLSNT